MLISAKLNGLGFLDELTAEVCVIGSGPVGLALAFDLARRGHRVLLLEAGEIKPSVLAEEDSAAIILDPSRHADIALTSCRAFGGNAWLWGGRCVAFDQVDFARGDHDLLRRWPIDYKEIAPFFTKAASFLDCGSGDLFGGLVPAGSLTSSVERWCANPVIPRRASFERPNNLVTVIGLTVTALELEGNRVKALEVANESGRRHFSGAQHYVVACGGLETARLLLITQQKYPSAFGGKEGALGRYYMGHVSGHPTRVRFCAPSFARNFSYRDDGHAVMRSRLTLAASLQLQNELPNVAFWPANPELADPIHKNGLLSLIFLILATPGIGTHLISEGIRQMQMTSNPSYGRHVRNVAFDLPNVVGEVIGLLSQMLIKGRRKPFFFLYAKDGTYPLHYHAEHLPSPHSRVWLSESTDRLGRARLSIDIRFSADDADGIARAHFCLDDCLREAGIGEVFLERSAEGREALSAKILSNARDGFSQIGLARMGSHARDGVVDRNCRVFDLDNLYLAGSAVFRSSGQANPTLPAVALAFRLSEHLDGRLSRTHELETVGK
jgi:hypothetical protein